MFSILQKSTYITIQKGGIKTHKDKTGKFGRILGELVWEDSTINKIMVDEHYAVLYNGQSKEDIEEQHLENRKRLIEAGKI